MAFFTPNSKTSITIRTRQVSVFLCVFFLLEFNLAQAKSIPPNANIEEEETYYQKCKAFIKKHDVEKPFVRSIVCDHTLPAPSDEVRDKSRLIENVFYHSVCVSKSDRKSSELWVKKWTWTLTLMYWKVNMNIYWSCCIKTNKKQLLV